MADIEDDFSDTSSVATDSDDDDVNPGTTVLSKKPKIKIITDADDIGSDDDDDNEGSLSGSDVFDNYDDDDLDKREKTFDSDDEYNDAENYRLQTLTEEANMLSSDDEDYDDSDDDGEQYLQKFSEDLKHNVIERHHPELMMHNYQEVEAMCRIVRDEHGNIIDPLHKTMPFITKFEKAKLLGERAKQINAGAQPMVQVEDEIIDGYLIALKEYEERKIPMIIRRPLPNGGSEYWRVADLELLV
jgi:DNA-directed RNA polymerase I, II, and III subunit RPABC2